MNRRVAESLRDEAAEPILARIRSDIARVRPLLRPMLEHIASQLFDPQLQYNRMCSQLGINSHNRGLLFRQELGTTPARYIRDCRFEVAADLLRRSDLRVQDICRLLGLSSTHSFINSFKIWSGVPPGWFRKNARGKGLPKEGKLLPRDALPSTPGMWRRLAADALSPEESTAVARHLVETYPAVREWLVGQRLMGLSPEPAGNAAARPSSETALGRAELELVMARAVWLDVAALPPAARRERLRLWTCFETPALVEHLGEKSLELGRQDAEEGVHVARLALTAATQLEDAGDQEGSAPQTALAWMRLGNALRVSGDVVAADAALSAAEHRLPGSSDAGGDSTRAQLYELRTILRLWQHRFDEALEASDVAIHHLRLLGEPSRIAKALIARAQIYFETGCPADALVAATEAETILGDSADVYVQFSAAFELAQCRHELGDCREAMRSLDAARNFAANVPNLVCGWALTWLEARIAARAGKHVSAVALLVKVIPELEQHGKTGEAGLALLDLAIVRAEQGRPKDAARVAKSALKTFAELQQGREATVAAQLISDWLQESANDPATLNKARRLFAVAFLRVPRFLTSGPR